MIMYVTLCIAMRDGFDNVRYQPDIELIHQT